MSKRQAFKVLPLADSHYTIRLIISFLDSWQTKKKKKAKKKKNRRKTKGGKEVKKKRRRGESPNVCQLFNVLLCLTGSGEKSDLSDPGRSSSFVNSETVEGSGSALSKPFGALGRPARKSLISYQRRTGNDPFEIKSFVKPGAARYHSFLEWTCRSLFLYKKEV